MTTGDRAILILMENGFEDMELMYPLYRLREAGYRTIAAAPKAGQTYQGKHGYPWVSDAAIDDIEEKDFAGIILPGGWCPDKLRRAAKVKDLIAAFDRSQKLVAAICHGGWMAISAGVYRGVRVTGSLGIKDDLENAGAIFESAPVVIDRHFVSSRNPDDLPAFMQGVLGVLSNTRT
ncbi:type 1 glutamine amidotransferase domain-containing protein [Telmatospirillum sp.]|uniref:type 1 glutamine amidotransferase domain-containing protein n=1 Tax=Telmatospirillum sp. TaxID=2079197 RepID=UPI002849F9E3|nr:type 1 glutamine amidotransferase domain-containing protein [Telmatospirillum sp.]MDR3436744.1 type 1 glutamine amidotransferase [Telmatospirillum sp.]